MYAAVGLSKKKKKKKASSIATSEVAASEDMYSVVDRKGKSSETSFSEKFEWAAAEYSELDPSKINESLNHTCVSSNSLPAAQVENGLRAHFQKFKLLYALTVVLCLISLIFLILFIILFVKVASLEMTNSTVTNSQPDTQLESLRKVVETLQLSNKYVYNNSLLGISPGFADLPSSCAAILEHNSSSTSDYYFVRSLSGQLRSVYCDMRRTCGNITGGWTRIAMLDIQNCPLELKQKTFSGNITTCVVRENDLGCTSTFYSSQDIPYSKVSGEIRAYQIGSPDGFFRMHDKQDGINGNYLD